VPLQARLGAGGGPQDWCASGPGRKECRAGVDAWAGRQAVTIAGQERGGGDSREGAAIGEQIWENGKGSWELGGGGDRHCLARMHTLHR
jgi:hypothetical protein